ncbi:MAG: ABC transporter ATP-binding protein [Chloroflexia bacterium]|nr:ABC transporter ATP-binding protein [Chloroflexia bacterium]
MDQPVTNEAPVLSVDDLSKRFGGVQAVDKVSLDIAPGRITGVIGPNGSGKSTLFNLMTGVARADSGAVTFQGTDITRLSSDRINRLGIGRTFQLTRLFGKMSAIENLVVVSRHDRATAERNAAELLDLVSLGHVRDEYAENLSYGQQKLLEFVRLMMTDPSLIMLDEPFAGVNPIMERRLLDTMRAWLDAGKTIVLTDHEMAIMMEICDDLYVLDYGEVIAHGPPAVIRDDERVMEAYFGR